MLFELKLSQTSNDDLNPLPFKTLKDMGRQEEDLMRIRG